MTLALKSPQISLFPTPSSAIGSLGASVFPVQWEKAGGFVHRAHSTHRAGCLDWRCVGSGSR